MAGGLVGFELVGMAGAAEGRDLIAGGDAVWRGVAGGFAVFFALAVAGVAADSLGEVRMRLDISCWFCMALLAELVLLGQQQEKQ